MTSIALVVLDTLRKDAFDRHFGWLSGRRFERAYSTANWTVPAHASLFTGRYASEVGIHAENTYCNCPEPTLAERLASAGYTTRAFSANTNVTGHFDFDRGFADFRTPELVERSSDEVFDWRQFSRTTGSTGVRKYLSAIYQCAASDVETIRSLKTGLDLKLSADAGVEYGGTREAIEEFRDTDFGDREFLFLNLMEAHEPYEAPSEYTTVPQPALTKSVGDISLDVVNGERTRQAYDDCVRYLSDVYHGLFDRLTEEFEYVITLSDHGELLGEHDAWGHEHGLYPELTRVPLVVSGNGLAGECSATVNLLDVHATVLELAGIDADVRGQNLVGDVDGQEGLTEFLGLTSWSERKLRQNGYERQVERYDTPLRGCALPATYYGHETIDGFGESGESDASDPRRRLSELVDELEVRQVERNNEVPAEVRNRLEQLGYA
jgi:arylsulfatase